MHPIHPDVLNYPDLDLDWLGLIRQFRVILDINLLVLTSKENIFVCPRITWDVAKSIGKKDKSKNTTFGMNKNLSSKFA
jgi:hypothetical protein